MSQRASVSHGPAPGPRLARARLDRARLDRARQDRARLDRLDSAWQGRSPACTSCTVTPPAALGAAIAYHRGNAEDLLYGGYTDASAPAAPATTWI